MNELSSETSPYLLQHAANPVHWKAWNDPALELAVSGNRLLIISVGYSACHWCHVMEHETFEDQEAANVMNRDFVCIKVDREERPDIDAVYMKAVQIMTGRGGWPMNIVALPDGRPVWGGTYFRKEEWMASLTQLSQLWESDPQKMTGYAEQLHEALEGISLPVITDEDKPADDNLIPALLEKWKKSFDHEFGGMARAPKFMMPDNYRFLLHYGWKNKDTELLDFVNLTLTRMAWGGLFDTVGGGFSRYSVDMKWHVPHFEKMLYDNAQLVSLYASAFRLTQNPLYRTTIEKTLEFVFREYSNGDGGYFSALDADSDDGTGKKEEGAYYYWTQNELQSLLGTDFPLFTTVFNINDFGHWEHGHFVLIQDRAISEIAEIHNITEASLQEKKAAWESLLLKERAKRIPPQTDDKTLASWNGLLLRGLVEAYKALQNPEYLAKAEELADFIQDKLWAAEGHLWRSYKNGRSTINAYLEDYAFIIDGLIALYEVSADESHLLHAKQLTDYSLENFFDENAGFFRFKSRLDPQLVAAHYEVEDNVIPASNSAMAENLYRLSVYFENGFYEKISRSMCSKILPGIDYPSAFSNWLHLELLMKSQAELAICGGKAVETGMEFYKSYHPGIVVAAATKETALPFLSGRFSSGKTQLYFCQDKTCGLPFDNLSQLPSSF